MNEGYLDIDWHGQLQKNDLRAHDLVDHGHTFIMLRGAARLAIPCLVTAPACCANVDIGLARPTFKC